MQYEKVLLIYDNLEVLEDFLLYNPSASAKSSVHIILTSRILFMEYPTVEVQEFSAEEVKSYLDNRLKIDVLLERAVSLGQELGYLPLAIVQSVAYMMKYGKSLEAFLKLLQTESRQKVLDGLGSKLKAVATLWKINLEKLSPKALEVIRLCAYLDPDNIPKALLEQMVDNVEPDEVLYELRSQSLLIETGVDREYFKIHRLLQEAVRRQLSQEQPKTLSKAIIEKGIQSLKIIIGNTWEKTDAELHLFWKERKAIFLQINCLLKENHKIDDILLAMLLEWLGDYQQHIMVQYSKSLESHQKSLTIRKKVYEKEDHPEIAASLQSVGKIYYIQGKYTQSLELYQRALTIRKIQYGNNSSLVAQSLNNIGIVYFFQGQYENALEYYQQSLNIRKSLYGENKLKTVAFFNNIGTVYYVQEKYPEALSYYQKDLTILKNFYGDNHPAVATTLNNIGGAYYSQGKYEEALKYHQQSLNIKIASYGENHPQVAQSLNNIGITYYSQGKYEEALKHHQQSLNIKIASYGENHPEVASSFNNMGEVYKSEGQHEKALEYYQKSLEIRRVTFGENHPEVASSFNNMGEVYDKQKQYIKSLEYYQKSLAIRKAIFKDNHPKIKKVIDNIQEIQAKLNSLTESAHSDNLEGAIMLHEEAAIQAFKNATENQGNWEGIKASYLEAGQDRHEAGIHQGSLKALVKYRDLIDFRLYRQAVEAIFPNYRLDAKIDGRIEEQDGHPRFVTSWYKFIVKPGLQLPQAGRENTSECCIHINAPGSRNLTSDIDTSVVTQFSENTNKASFILHADARVKDNGPDYESRITNAMIDNFYNLSEREFGLTSGEHRDSNVYVDLQDDYPKFRDDEERNPEVNGQRLFKAEELAEKLAKWKLEKHRLELAASLFSLRVALEEKGWIDFKNQVETTIQGGCDLCLMSDLPSDGKLKSGKMYLEKQEKQLKYTVINPKGETVEALLDISVTGSLTREFLDSKKSAILDITSKRGHTLQGSAEHLQDGADEGEEKAAAYVKTTLEDLRAVFKQTERFFEIYHHRLTAKKAELTATRQNQASNLSKEAQEKDLEVAALNCLYVEALEEMTTVNGEILNLRKANQTLIEGVQSLYETLEEQAEKLEDYKKKPKLYKKEIDESERQYASLNKDYESKLNSLRENYLKIASKEIEKLELRYQSHTFANEAYVCRSAVYHVVTGNQQRGIVAITEQTLLGSALQQIGFKLLHSHELTKRGRPIEEVAYRTAKYGHRVHELLFKEAVTDKQVQQALKPGNKLNLFSRLKSEEMRKSAFTLFKVEELLCLNVEANIITQVKNNRGIPEGEKYQKTAELLAKSSEQSNELFLSIASKIVAGVYLSKFERNHSLLWGGFNADSKNLQITYLLDKSKKRQANVLGTDNQHSPKKVKLDPEEKGNPMGVALLQADDMKVGGGIEAKTQGQSATSILSRSTFGKDVKIETIAGQGFQKGSN